MKVQRLCKIFYYCIERLFIIIAFDLNCDLIDCSNNNVIKILTINEKVSKNHENENSVTSRTQKVTLPK